MNSKRQVLIKYLPHGVDPEVFKPILKEDDEFSELEKFKKEIFKDKDPKFVAFFNSRNMRRKQIPDTMLAFKSFLDSLPQEEAKKCYMILHTDLVSEHGTDLEAVREYLFGEKYPNNIIFSLQKFPPKHLNFLYNIADVQVLITSNEGWGLTLTESILSGTPILANVTGGMQDQMRFEYDMDEGPGVKAGGWIDFDEDFPSNHTGTYKKHGEWAFPVFPSSRSIQGSPQTPYIFDDRCKWEDVALQFQKLYKLTPEERAEKGMKGREWAMSEEAGFTSEIQGKRIIESFDELFKTWEPRNKNYQIVNSNEYKGKFINHSIKY